jgi:hypothetical protein
MKPGIEGPIATATQDLNKAYIYKAEQSEHIEAEMKEA